MSLFPFCGEITAISIHKANIHLFVLNYRIFFVMGECRGKPEVSWSSLRTEGGGGGKNGEKTNFSSFLLQRLRILVLFAPLRVTLWSSG